MSVATKTQVMALSMQWINHIYTQEKSGTKQMAKQHKSFFVGLITYIYIYI